VTVGDGVEDGEMAINGRAQGFAAFKVRVVKPTDAPEDRVERPDGVLQEALVGHCQDQPVHAPIESIERVDGHAVAALAQQALHVQEVVAVRRARSLRRQAEDEPLDVAPELQEEPLAREVDGGDLDPVPRADYEKGIV